MDEDPHVINNLLWEFVNLNLTGAAHEIFFNTRQSNGLEVLRKIHALIYAATERRQDELCEKIQHPRPAANAGEVAGAFENWDTNQRMHRRCGGEALREAELRSLLLKILPLDMKIQELQVMKTFSTWEALKDCVKEHARIAMVHTAKYVPTHLAETDNVCMSIIHEFLERTDD